MTKLQSTEESPSRDQTRPLLTGQDNASPRQQSRDDAMTAYLALAVFAAVLSSFQFGWCIGVSNNTETVLLACTETEKLFGFLPPCLPMTQAQWGTVVAMFSLGGLVGGLGGGQICKQLGRKSTLVWNNVFLATGALVLGLSTGIEWLAVGRFLVGIGCGVATAAVPMYVNEIAPVSWRGTLGALHQLAIVVGVVASQAAGVPFATVLGWRLLWAFPLVPAVVQWTLLFPFCVESPRYLIARGRHQRAVGALRRLRGRWDVEEEFEALVAPLSHGGGGGEGGQASGAGKSVECGSRTSSDDDNETAITERSSLTIPQLIGTPQLHKPLLLAVAAQLAQQLSGINAVILYSTAIFKQFLGDDKALVITVLLGVVNLVMTLVSVVLMDRAGRRVLMLTSQFGMAIISTMIVVSLAFNWGVLTVILMMSFIGVFAIGLGPIPWMIIAELFPTHAVAPAASIAVAVNWISTFVVSLTFPILQGLLKDFVFLPFAIISFVLGLLMLFKLPETKGRTPDEVLRLIQ